jgi:hypothetical protein
MSKSKQKQQPKLLQAPTMLTFRVALSAKDYNSLAPDARERFLSDVLSDGLRAFEMWGFKPEGHAALQFESQGFIAHV